MAFGDRLKEARESACLTRPQLAEKLGVTKSAISNYENGVSSPKENVMLKIFNALCIEPNFLFQDSFIKLDITNQEADIIRNYRLLNEEGQDKSADYIADLVDTGKYKKLDSPFLENKKTANEA